MTQKVIDQDVFADLKEATGDDFVAELVNTFLDETPGIIDDLKTTVLEADADGYRRAAHSIKSNASTFGATALAELAREMDLGALPSAADASSIDELQSSFDVAATELRSLIDD